MKRPLPSHHGHVTVLGEPPRLETIWPMAAARAAGVGVEGLVAHPSDGSGR